MKRIRSKKGLTLVELVVTIAILGIVATLGVGMVSSAIKNYSVAQTTAREQDTALSVEAFITDAARISGRTALAAADTIPEEDVTAFYLAFEGSTLKTVRAEKDDTTKKMVVTEMRYEGVKSISVQAKKQKPDVLGTVKEKNFIFLDYTIEMVEGYKLEGSTVMNNASTDYVTTTNMTSMTETDTKYVIQSGEKFFAIAIVK